MQLTLEYDYACPAATFWERYFDRDYVVRLHLEALGSLSAEVVEQTGDLEAGLTRTLQYATRPDAPGPVKKLFGSEITTTEISTFDPATSTASFTLTPGTLADKTQITGAITVTDTADGCHERFSIDARVRIFGAGPVVERFIERQAKDMQTKAVAFFRTEVGES